MIDLTPTALIGNLTSTAFMFMMVIILIMSAFYFGGYWAAGVATGAVLGTYYGLKWGKEEVAKMKARQSMRRY